MEGLNNSNTTVTAATTASSSSIISLNLPLDSFATSSVSSTSQYNPDILAICFADETSKGANCYVYSTCLGGSEVCEISRQVGISEEKTALFVREMKQLPSIDDDAAHPNSNSNYSIVKNMVDATLTITSNDSKQNTWLGFKSEGALYLKGNGWDDMDIRESVVAALDLAEEQFECEVVYLCLEKSNPYLAKLVRALMYAGFEVVTPGILEHADPKYLVLGMEL
ncbi:hypothetical protein BGZ76_001645 [Entomortierella beljakovae]|nr:hypothetical protein BGZ76_001645 [Entomortierella beljakovae]